MVIPSGNAVNRLMFYANNKNIWLPIFHNFFLKVKCSAQISYVET